MKLTRPTLFAAVALTMACATANADPAGNQAGANCDTIARVEIVSPFQLQQNQTQKVSDCVSRSTYSGQGTLLVTPCNNGQPYNLPVRLELRTTTTLNQCGDGITDGQFALTSLANLGAPAAIVGDFSAVNRNNGELQGLVTGTLRQGDQQFGKNKGHQDKNALQLRAVFNGTFVKDSAGQYTLVNVTNTHGVLYFTSKAKLGGNNGDQNND